MALWLPVLGFSVLATWIYLLLLHGRFWQAEQRFDAPIPLRERWPGVAAVVPARDEAELLARSLGSLLDQDYPGPFSIVLVDDGSEDGTGDVARAIAASHPNGRRLIVARAGERPKGWVGKMWAVATGVREARRSAGEAEYLLLTDADIAHAAATLRRLVSFAEARSLDLVSLMPRLRCESRWEKLLIPAFVYFFQKLYPFRWVNDPRRRVAGAAGGCMLVRSKALERAGGIEAIRGELIDDCALARCIKDGGPIWLELSERVTSLRAYPGLREIWNMVARSAYTQLHHSKGWLAATVLGLGLVYLAPPLIALGWPVHRDGSAALLALGAWYLQAWTFLPSLRLYERPVLSALALPGAAFLYLAMTLDSARRYHCAAGAIWKGRSYGRGAS